MKINEAWGKIKQSLHDKYITNEEKEWVYIEIININRLDVDIVSDKVNSIKQLKDYIRSLIDDINEDLEGNIKLYLGHVNFHSIDEAEFFDLQKPKERTFNNLSFGELIDAGINNVEKISDKENNKSNIISFYSYKGGVGRTVALIQTAYLLAKEGKNVLLMDLDIEAPSFFNIFKDDVKSKYGLVDYLYEKLYFNEDEIKITHIISKLNLNLKGEIYIIPAGRSNIGYVKKLEKLKEKRIYENKLIQNVIEETEKKYYIDYTLVDSRTGINNWGALSLIDISDEVILFAYPNRENIDGIKLIMELIQPYKMPTIVLSRIHDSLEGNKIAENLFKELNIEQEFIPVHYESSIALAQKYPIENATKSFEKISQFILQRENNIKYEDLIKNNKKLVDKIINNLYDNKKLTSIITTNERKIVSKNNWIIVIKDDNIDEIIHRVNSNIDIINDSKLNIDAKNFELPIDFTASILNKFNELALKEANKKGVSIKNKFKNFDEVKEYIKDEDGSTIPNKIIECLEVIFENSITEDTIYIIYFDKFMPFFNDENLEKSRKENILELFLLVLDLLTYSKIDINFKLVVDEKYYKEYEHKFKKHNSNMLNLVWEKNESSIEKIDEILLETVNSLSEEIKNDILNKLNLSDDYNKEFKKHNENFEDNKKIKKILNELNKNQTLDFNKNLIEIFNKINSYNNKFNEELVSFIYCTRIDKDTYSKLLNKWIYEELSKRNKLNRQEVIKLIISAAKFESESDDLNKSSIITFDSFEKAINNMS